MLRSAQFAGTWYPEEPQALRQTLKSATPPSERSDALAVMVPHAGYRYSLSIAAETFARVKIPAVAVILCPNHTVPPPIIALWPSGDWETPLGRVNVEEELAGLVRTECPQVVEDPAAHVREHAIELQLPILQLQRPDLQIVPLVVAAPELDDLRRLGEGLARAIQSYTRVHPERGVLLVASSDMTHFESAEAARAQDERALGHVLRLDPRGLLERCVRENITMCGVRPTTAVLYAAQALGASQAELVRYGNSGDVSGDHQQVVGYAGVVIR